MNLIFRHLFSKLNAWAVWLFLLERVHQSIRLPIIPISLTLHPKLVESSILAESMRLSTAT